MDYDNMPAGEEMDVEVARLVFGQTDFSHLPVVYEEGNTPDGEDGWSGFVCPRCRRPEDILHRPCVQRYSTDIAEAWKVVEKLVHPATRFGEVIISYEGDFVEVDVGKWIESENAWMLVVEGHYPETTVPLAICRAALSAILAPLA